MEKLEFKGTKGSWKYRDGYRNDIVTDDDRCFGICDLGTEQEAYLSDYPIEELQANAKLIAASPDLLEALQHGLRLAESLPNKESIAVKLFIKSAVKAIEKALK